MKSKFIDIALKKGPKENKYHIWGDYKEILLGKNVMSRIIKFYDGGMTSVHKHPIDEMIFIELGKVHFWSGKDPKNLKKEKFGPGSLIYIPSGTWHSIGCSKKISDELPFALGVEYIFGDIKSGRYKIHKFLPAKKCNIKK